MRAAPYVVGALVGWFVVAPVMDAVVTSMGGYGNVLAAWLALWWAFAP